MKKTIALLLTVLFLFISLVSCSTANKNNEGSQDPSASTQSSSSAPTAATPDTPTEETPTPYVPADPNEVLKGKTALFCGDSIVMASTYDKEHQWWGWAGRIKQNYALKSQTNAGVDGASVSDCRGSNLIVNQVENNKKGKYDFVILEGGTNDAWDVIAVGRIVPKPASECTPADFDRNTFAGGLENMLYTAKRNYPNAAIGYVITTQMNNAVGCVSDMSRYVNVTRLACEKWGVPCLDLYNNEDFINEYKPLRKTNTPDGIHPNSAGYEIYQKYIAQFMADIYGKTYEPKYEEKPGVGDVKKALESKRVLFVGDSIGAKTSHDERTEYYAYGGRIIEAYGLSDKSKNVCVSGASISTVRGDNTVYNQARNERGNTYDMIVIEGGVNDAWDSAKVGKLSDMSVDDFDVSALDTSTLAGGLEQLFYSFRKYNAKSTLVYVINYKLNYSAGSLKNMTSYVKMIEKACKKWGVEYLDLYNDGWFNASVKVATKEYIADGIHPNTKGYDFMAPVIAEFMADVFLAKSKQ